MALKVPVQVYPVQVEQRENIYSKEFTEHPFAETIRINRSTGTYNQWKSTQYEGSSNMPSANGLIKYKYD